MLLTDHCFMIVQAEMTTFCKYVIKKQIYNLGKVQFFTIIIAICIFKSLEDDKNCPKDLKEPLSVKKNIYR